MKKKIIFWTLLLVGKLLEANNCPVLMFDRNRSGYARESVAGSLDYIWSYLVIDSIRTSPVVYFDKVIFGSKEGSIWFLDSKTGETIKQFNASGPMDATPAVANGVVVAPSRDKNIYLFDTKPDTEEPLKIIPAGSEIISSPLIYNNQAVLLSGYPQNQILIIDLEKKEISETYPTSQFSFCPPTLTKGKLIYGTNDGKIHIFDLNLKQETFSYQTKGGSFYQSIVAVGDNFYVLVGADERKILAFSIFGQKLWETPQLDSFYQVVSGLASDGKDIYGVVSVSTTIKLVSYNCVSGSKKFEKVIAPNANYSYLASPVISAGIVYLGTPDGKLLAISSEDGQVLNSINLGGAVFTAPAISNGYVYVTTDNGYIFAYKATKATAISYPEEGVTVSGKVPIYGILRSPDMSQAVLEYARENSSDYQVISTTNTPVESSVIGIWNTTDLAEGNYNIRLKQFDTDGKVYYSFATYFVTQSTSVYVDITSTTTVTLPDGTEVIIPPNSLSQNDYLTITKLTSPPETGVPENCRKATTAREFKFSKPDTKLTGKATIKIPYTNSDFSPAPKAELLRIYYYDENQGKYRLLNSLTGREGQTENYLGRISAEVTHFTIFRLMEFGVLSQLLFSDMTYSYPNPARLVDKIYFKYYLGDDAKVTIDIYNLNGEQIAHLEKENNPAGMVSQIEWDIKSIASGVYVYRVEAKNSSGKSESITKKLAIIK